MSRPDPNFTDVCRLLRAKKYEQPPPGYFNSFADKVIARIEAEEAIEYSSWWNWVVNRFDAKPVLVCAYGLAVSGLLFAGFRLSRAFEAEMAKAPSVGGPWLAATPSSPFLVREYDTVVYGRIAPASLTSDSRSSFKDLLMPVSAALPAGFPTHRH